MVFAINQVQRVFMDWKLTVSLIALIILTVLPFFDQRNLVTLLWIQSHLYSNRLFFSGVGWPGGPFFLTMWMPAYIVYIASNFNIYLSLEAMKALLLAMLLLFAFLMYVYTDGKKDKRTVLFFALLNPAIIYVTLIWTQWDIFPAVLSLLSFLLLRNIHRDNAEDVKIHGYVIALIPLMIGIFMVYYPIIFLPLLYMYSPKPGKWKFMAASAALLAIFGLSDILFFRGFSLSYVSNLNGSGLSVADFQGLQHYIPLTLTYYVILLVVIAIALPLALKLLKFNESSAAYIVLLIFLLTSASAGFDTFIWLVPFAYLSVIDSRMRVRIRDLVITNLPIFLAVLFFANIIMGNRYGKGIFYFGYFVFHINYVYGFLGNIIYFDTFINIYNILLLISSFLALVFLVLNNGNTSFAGHGKETGTVFPRAKSGIRSNGMKRSRLAISIIVIIMVLILLSVVFSNSMSTITKNGDTSGPPVGMLQPVYYPDGALASSVNNRTYTWNSNGMTIPENAPPLGFWRQLNNTGIYLNGTVKLPSFSPGLHKVISADNLSAYVQQNESISVDSLSQGTLVQEEGAIHTYEGNSVFTNATQINTVSGYVKMNYSVDSAPANSTITFGFNLVNLSTQDNLVLNISEPGVGNVFMSSFTKTYAYVIFGGMLHIVPYGRLTYSNWNFVMISFGGNSTTMSINGMKQIRFSLPENGQIKASSFNVKIGSLGGYDLNSSSDFSGLLTPIFISPFQPMVLNTTEDVISFGNTIEHTMQESNYTYFSIEASSRGAHISFGAVSAKIQNSIRNLSVGKLSSGDWGISIVFSNIKLYEYGSHGFYFISDFWFFVFPLVFLIYAVPCYLNSSTGETEGDDIPGK